MNRIILQVIGILFICLLLAGCWDKRELNELAIATAISIDKRDDKFHVAAQVVIPTELSMKGGTGSSPVTLYEASGESINEAIRKLTKVTPRYIYLGHLRVVVISEDLAKEGIGATVDFLSRGWELRSDFYLIVSKESDAKEILNVQTALEKIPANELFNILHTSEAHYASTVAVTFFKMKTNLERDGKQGVLTGVQILGDPSIGSSKGNVETIVPEAKIQFEELAIFKGDKLVGWLNEKESRGYNGVINQVKSSIGLITCPDGGNISVGIKKFNSKMKSKKISNNPGIELKVDIVANLGEINCDIDLTKLANVNMLEKEFGKMVKEDIQRTIEVVQQKYRTDIFGFGATIYKQSPEEWKKLKENWDEVFVELPVNIKVNTQISHFGSVLNPVVSKTSE
ncbi:Ger(x)C family spore germination protein [Psychrobacillus psychrodurans]|uniref:Ger(X)C family spore germination protein n=1 Tax=Psychrobacillus psychrodurans TaxID=126157 RepID=A0A9X3L743_9BACI|nr:Ger(x)C family spore germination protein [Psychrobacillus psychrodurans]MCZ8532541.1 Ger(x)C family spore germination protein [Psychrobacillus psychrodurans]